MRCIHLKSLRKRIKLGVIVCGKIQWIRCNAIRQKVVQFGYKHQPLAFVQ